MRRRLIVIYVTLLAVVLVGLNVPLAIALANNVGNQMFVDRQGDTTRFASLAEPALRTNQTVALADELRQYDEMFGIAAVIVARDGRPIITSRRGIDVTLVQAAQPFWRSASHQNIDGAGLGITIADALVTASGGRFDLMPARPHGLHARVRLPAGPP